MIPYDTTVICGKESKLVLLSVPVNQSGISQSWLPLNSCMWKKVVSAFLQVFHAVYHCQIFITFFNHCNTSQLWVSVCVSQSAI